MSEFSSRVESQRRLLKLANRPFRSGEPLLALNAKAIERWIASNQIDPSSEIVKVLQEASTRIFAMANHSDDPVCGAYRLSASELNDLGLRLELALEG